MMMMVVAALMMMIVSGDRSGGGGGGGGGIPFVMVSSVRSGDVLVMVMAAALKVVLFAIDVGRACRSGGRDVVMCCVHVV